MSIKFEPLDLLIRMAQRRKKASIPVVAFFSQLVHEHTPGFPLQLSGVLQNDLPEEEMKLLRTLQQLVGAGVAGKTNRNIESSSGSKPSVSFGLQ